MFGGTCTLLPWRRYLVVELLAAGRVLVKSSRASLVLWWNPAAGSVSGWQHRRTVPFKCMQRAFPMVGNAKSRIKVATTFGTAHSKCAYTLDHRDGCSVPNHRGTPESPLWTRNRGTAEAKRSHRAVGSDWQYFWNTFGILSE